MPKQIDIRLRRLSKHTMMLLAILALGLFLRLHCLTCESLWLDEGFTLNWVFGGPVNILLSAAGDVQAPLYFLALYGWTSAFGTSEFTLRSMSMLFGFLAIPMMFMVCGLLFDRRTGLISSLLFSLSTFQIYFSQEARSYSLLVFLTLASMYFYLRIGEGRRFRLAYVTSTVLMLYTHVFGLFIAIAQNIHYLITRKGLRLRGWIALQAATGVLYLPWALVLLFQIITIKALGPGSNIAWIPLPTLGSISLALFEYSGYYYLIPYGYGTPTFQTLTLLSQALSLLVIILAIKPFLAMEGKTVRLARENREELYFLLLWLFTPILLPFLLSYVVTPIFWVKYTIVASPAFYILASRGISSIRVRPLLLALLITTVSLSMVDDARYYMETNKEQWREAAYYMASEARPGDLLLFYEDFTRYSPFEYYLNREDVDIRPLPSDMQELNALVEEYDRTWLILSHDTNIYDETETRIRQTILETHALVEERDFFVISVELYEQQ